MKLSPFRAFFAGMVAVLVFAGSVVGLDTALHRLFPDLLDSMAALIFGSPEIILVLLVGMTLYFGIGMWMLRPLRVKTRVFILLIGGIAAIAWFMALSYAFPAANRYLWVAGTALIGGIIFALQTAILSTRLIYRMTISLLLIGLGALTASVQYNSGTQRAQLAGLKNAGYVIYIPADSSGRTVKTIVSEDKKYDGYKDGVVVTLSDGEIMIEQKIDHRPTQNCSSPFIRAESQANSDTDPLKDYSCRLVASNNGVDVFMLERKSYASYYDDYDVSRAYFAVAGSTWIYKGDALSVHDVMDPKAQVTPEQLKDFDDTKTMYLELVPATDFSPYLSKH